MTTCRHARRPRIFRASLKDALTLHSVIPRCARAVTAEGYRLRHYQSDCRHASNTSIRRRPFIYYCFRARRYTHSEHFRETCFDMRIAEGRAEAASSYFLQEREPAASSTMGFLCGVSTLTAISIDDFREFDERLRHRAGVTCCRH